MTENHPSTGLIEISTQNPARFAWMKTCALAGFAILIVLFPFRLRLVLAPVDIPPIFSDYTDILFFTSEGVLLVTLMFWGLHIFFARPGYTLGPRFITYPLIGVTLAALVSAFTSVEPLLSWIHVLRLVVLFFFYLFIVNIRPSGAWLHVPIMVQVGVQSIVSVTQFVLQRSIGLGKLGELALDPSWFGVSIVWAPGQIALRSYGLTDHPNILGGSLALGLVFLLVMLPVTPEKRRIPAALTIGAGLTALLLSFSRAAWLGLAVGLAASFWILLRTGRKDSVIQVLKTAISTLIVVLPFFIAILPFLSSRFSVPTEIETASEQGLLSPEDRSIEERRALIRAANALFVDHALTGTGVGTFPVALHEYFPDFAFYFQPVHFILLDAAVEIGLPGALFYTLAIGLPFVALRYSRKRLTLTHELVAASGMLAVIIIVGLFDYYPWFLTPGRLLHWFVWGAWGAFYVERGAYA